MSETRDPGLVSYVAGCAMGFVIIVGSLGILYPVAVAMRLGRQLARAFAGHRPPRMATL